MFNILTAAPPSRFTVVVLICRCGSSGHIDNRVATLNSFLCSAFLPHLGIDVDGWIYFCKTSVGPALSLPAGCFTRVTDDPAVHLAAPGWSVVG